MSKVLYIKANAKSAESSRTYKISDHFVEIYKKSNPEDEIKTLDLYAEGIRLLSAEDINTIFGKKDVESKSHPILKYAYEFSEADKFIIAEPMWNLSVPAILKAYIDYISVSGITFKYTAEGPVGLCKGKAVNITSRGGEYSHGPGAAFEMGDRYLRTIFAFFGIQDFVTIAANSLDVIGNDVDGILKKAMQEAESAAKTF